MKDFDMGFLGAFVAGIFGKTPVNKFKVMDHEVEVMSILKDGKVIFTSDRVNSYPKDHLEGKIFEVMFKSKEGSPYFAYYICHDYYIAVAAPGGAAKFGGASKTEQFRTAVSQRIGLFLAQYVKNVMNKNGSIGLQGFRHNRMHTNVLTYISSKNTWYPIMHNDYESDDASEIKAGLINSGLATITSIVAMRDISPSQ